MGDYASIGAARVTADLMVPAGQVPLAVRLVLFQEPATQFSARWTSASSVSVPANGEWNKYEFSLAEQDLTLVLNSGTYAQLMADVGQVMFRHDAGGPSSGGVNISSILGLDNITLAAAEEPVLAGDYNDDGVVSLADYTVWRDNLGAPEGTLEGDLVGGAIDADQYTQWKEAFGATSTNQPATERVAEPASYLGCIVAAVFLFNFRRTSV